MPRLIATLTLAFTSLTLSPLFGQFGYHRSYVPPISHHHVHSIGHGHVVTPDLLVLDEMSDRLARIARHLHQDAHRLSRDDYHSAAIEHYVESLDRSQSHLHDVLHRAIEVGTCSQSVVRHARRDVAQAKVLMLRLNRELQHQGADGACPENFQLIYHMRQILVGEAFPVLQAMERELYGVGSIAVPPPLPSAVPAPAPAVESNTIVPSAIFHKRSTSRRLRSFGRDVSRVRVRF